MNKLKWYELEVLWNGAEIDRVLIEVEWVNDNNYSETLQKLQAEWGEDELIRNDNKVKRPRRVVNEKDIQTMPVKIAQKRQD